MESSYLRVFIHEKALRSNIQWLKSRHGALLPVIKADAYGHGLCNVAEILQHEGIEHMATGTVHEAVLLRQHGIGGQLVALLGAMTPCEATLAAHYNITVLVHDEVSLQLAAACHKPLQVAIKINTGMERLGFSPEKVSELVDVLLSYPYLQPYLVLSHLASADNPDKDAYTHMQIERFYNAAVFLRQTWPFLRTSLGNSAGSLRFSGHAGDLARPGISLYGVNPLQGTAEAFLGNGLVPVMEVQAPVLAIRSLEKGQALGYGCSFVAPYACQIAVIGAGYADGLHRALSNGGRAEENSAVVLHKKRAPLRGRVCMQMCMAECSSIHNVRVGDMAHILGGGCDNAITADDVAAWAGTIAYEVLCGLGKGARSFV